MKETEDKKTFPSNKQFLEGNIKKVIKIFPKFKLRSLLGLIHNYIYYFRFNKKLLESNRRIQELHNKHKDGRCFIVGTGPSLEKTNLSLIKNEIVFGVNDLYRGIKKFGIRPKYWVAVGYNEQMVHSILSLPNTTVFFGGNLGRTYLKEHYPKGNPIIIKNFKEIKIWKKLSKDLLKGVYGGATVIETALQIAYYLGFKEIYLLGCDCSYPSKTERGRKQYYPSETIRHFDEEGSIDYGVPCIIDWDGPLRDYKICKEFFDREMTDRKVINCTVGGKLEFFERIKLEDVVGN